MPRGKPDWSPNNPGSGLNSIDELAAAIIALGGNAGFNRDGLPIVSDNFADGLAAWIAASDGTGSSVALDTAVSFQGKQAVKLTGGADGSRQASLTKIIPQMSEGIFRTEVFIKHLTDATVYALSINVTKDLLLHNAIAQILPSSGELKYNAQGGIPTLIDTFDWMVAVDGDWHVLSLAVNLETFMYENIAFDDTRYDLSTIPMHQQAATGEHRIQTSIIVTNVVGENGVIIVDNFRISLS